MEIFTPTEAARNAGTKYRSILVAARSSDPDSRRQKDRARRQAVDRDRLRRGHPQGGQDRQVVRGRPQIGLGDPTGH